MIGILSTCLSNFDFEAPWLIIVSNSSFGLRRISFRVALAIRKNLITDRTIKNMLRYINAEI